MKPSTAGPALLAFAAALLIASCGGGPKPAAEPVAEPVALAEPAPEPAPPAEPPTSEPAAFDPATVTEALRSATFVDVRAFIDSLNQIIRRQDYESWLSHLTDDYVAYYSDPEVLAKFSEYPVIKRKGIKLQTLKDYFINVVYPSRQNDKVDDIEFVGENLIKAITVSPKGDRNILYMLEKHGDAWKIGIGR
jgi:hypothetical protein